MFRMKRITPGPVSEDEDDDCDDDATLSQKVKRQKSASAVPAVPERQCKYQLKDAPVGL